MASPTCQKVGEATPIPVQQKPDRGANIEAKGEIDLTPLHLASRRGNQHIVKLLLDRGANIEAKDKDGRAPVHLASSNFGRQESVKLLFDWGANIEPMDTSSFTIKIG